MQQPPAKPVAWLLVRNAADKGSAREQLRTKLGFGILVHETRSTVTENGFWQIGGVFGPFDSMELAERFVHLWQSNGDDMVDAKTTRGPIMRFSRAMAIATRLQLQSWIDFPVVSNCSLQFHDIRVIDGDVIAFPHPTTTIV